jgi:parallel beta-helix repeat protein
MSINTVSRKTVSKNAVRIVTIALVAAAGLLGQSLMASTVVVGPPTCRSGYPHYSTIQSAVSTVPFNTIVMICPGSYPEQVTVSQPLTLEGVTDGTGSAAVITVPAAGLVQNGTSNSFGAVAVQLLVQNTVGVTIKDLIVDGTGGNCPATFVYPNRIVGIGILDVGSSNDGATAAKVESVVVRNEQACSADGILADTSYATITASEIHDINQTAIDAYSGQYSLTSNSIQRAEAYGIVLVSDVSGSVVSENNVSDSFDGILSSNTVNNASITNNTVLNSSYVGLWIYFSSHQTVTGNIVSNALWPLVVEGGSSDTVQNNKCNDAFYDGILDELSSGGNTITKNTVNEGPFGIFADGTTSGDTLVPNTFNNVVTTLDPGPVTGPAAPVQP